MADIANQVVGIVVPVYKLKRRYLEECVRSILAQSHRNIRIILVNDGSPDDCGETCNEIARWDSRIIVKHHENNQGLPIARNTGIDAVEVDWYMFVDGDDWIDPTACERLLKSAAIYQYDLDMIIGSGYRSYPTHEDAAIFVRDDTLYDTKEALECLQIKALSSAKKENAFSVAIDSACFKLFNSRLFYGKNIRFRPLRYREDGLFFQEALEVSSRVLVTPICFYHYRMTAGSMVNGLNPNMPALHDEYLSCLWDFSEKASKGHEYNHALAYAVFLSMQICITQYYYHPDNGMSRMEKRKACMEHFSKKPYCDSLRLISFASLTKNHLVKALCMKLGWFRGVQLLRSVYFALSKKEAYE